jgi:hypothetical protein
MRMIPSKTCHGVISRAGNGIDKHIIDSLIMNASVFVLYGVAKRAVVL